jgi:hypothetical protein
MSADLSALANVVYAAIVSGRVVDDQLVTWRQLLTFVDEANTRGADS